MELKKLQDNIDKPFTALLYCPPGVGKSTAIGIIAEQTDGNTLVLDVDRTISRTLAKKEVVKDISKIFVREIDNVHTWDDWCNMTIELKKMLDSGEFEKNNIKNIAVDNVSELERCILADLGSQGKNKGVPAMGDYQYMQFKLVSSLRFFKSLGLNIIWTAWEDVRDIVNLDGSKYSQLIPKVNLKIVDNVCGLCDVVGKIFINEDGEHGIRLEASNNVYAKNQIDDRKAVRIEDFTKFRKVKEEK